jgi:hypothetical protein
MEELERGKTLSLVSEHARARVDVTPVTDAVFKQGLSTLDVAITPLGGDGIATLEAAHPFMPAHGHGTSAPVVVAVDGGYRVEELNLFMPGRWEVTLDLTVDGFQDTAGFALDVE